jgi:uncharacterized protein (TIRG00374 family)
MMSRRYWIGLIISTIFLVILISQIDYKEMIQSLREANYFYVFPGICVYFISLYFRSIRWKYLLSPFGSTTTARLYPVLLVGYLANNILPLRAGEFVRSYYLATREKISSATGLATVLVERVFDGLTLILFLFVGGLFLPLSPLVSKLSETAYLHPQSIIAIVVSPFVLVFALIIFIAIKPNIFLSMTRKFLTKLPRKFESTLSPLITRFINGFKGMNKPDRLFWVFLLSVPVWMAEAYMYLIIGYGFGIDNFFPNIWQYSLAMLIVVSVSNLATSFPSSQGSIGPFEVFGTIALVYLGVSNGVASAYVIILHLSLLLPVIIVGIAYMVYASLSLKQLTGDPRE